MTAATGRLPDLIFGRRLDIEQETGLVLAGTLVTDIPKGAKLRKRDQRLIQHLIRVLANEVKDSPDLAETGIWRDGAKPADGVSPLR